MFLFQQMTTPWSCALPKWDRCGGSRCPVWGTWPEIVHHCRLEVTTGHRLQPIYPIEYGFCSGAITYCYWAVLLDTF
jgi:hypothetical protein